MFGYAFSVLLGQLAILSTSPLKPEPCWSGRSAELCEKLILTVDNQRELRILKF